MCSSFTAIAHGIVGYTRNALRANGINHALRRSFLAKGLPRATLAAVSLLLAGCSHLVQIRTDPSDVTVTDIKRGRLGVTTGRRPIEVSVSSGESLDLTFSKDGYEERVISIPRIENDRTLFVELWNFATTLEVRSQPAGAGLKVLDPTGKPIKFVNPSDPAAIQSHTNQKYLMPAGVTDIELVIEKPGYKSRVERVRLKQRQNNVFSYELERLYASISIITQPEGVAVTEKYFNYIGTTPILSYEISAEKMATIFPNISLRNVTTANLELTLRKAGYETMEIVCPVKLNEPNDPLRIEMKKQNAKQEVSR